MNPRRHNLIIALVVVSTTFMELLDATILNTALPAMAQALAVRIIDLKAAITTYVVALSIFIPISGWIADRFGTKRTLLAAIGLFTAASAACGLARSLETLVLFRVVQGMGGALMTPVARLVIIRLFDRTELVRIAGLVALPAILGPVLGPLIGGYITSRFSWPWIFLVNVPIGLAAMAAIALLAERDPGRSASPFDFRGFLAGGIGLAVLTFALETVDDNWLNPVTLGLLFVLGGFLVGYTILHCKRVAHPVVDLSLFGIRTFRIGVLQVFLGLLAGGGIPFLVAVMLQAQLGYTPLESGLVLFVGAVGALMVKPMVSFLVQRLGFRCVLAGCPLGFAAVMGLLSTVQEQTPFVVLALFMFLFGCCQSVFMNMANAVPFLDVTEEKSSRATSLQGTLQQFSMSLGVTFAALLLHGWLAWEQVTLGDHSQTQLILGSFHWTFRILALVSLVNVFPALSWRDKEKTIEEQPVGVHLDRNR